MKDWQEQQVTRERQRVLFDSVADLYGESRQGYPEEVVRWMVETAGLTDGARVLEIGCGTGQLTVRLIELPFHVTAIDIGPSMIEAAGRRLGAAGVELVASSFEDFQAAPATFDLVVSATAFHWVDPSVAWAKAARLLRPGGWLAILYVGEKYDDPLGKTLLDAWIKHSTDGGAWARTKKPTVAELLAATDLFDAPLERSHSERVTLRPETVLGVERTRATYLSYDAPTQRSFDADLLAALRGLDEVAVEIQTNATMARVRAPSEGPGGALPQGLAKAADHPEL
jgi:ubiquinone/menaquinone biosynthesis C-methylase UbiE